MQILLTALTFIVVLGFMVLVHELGHFLVAKRAGIRVEEFAIGFPPKLFGLHRGETEYTINLLPLGGFVRMTGEDDPTDPRSFARAPKRWRAAVLLAGSTMNLITAGLIFALAFSVGWPEITEYQVGISLVTPDSPAQAAGLQAGDVFASVDGVPVRSNEQVRDLLLARAGQPVNVVVRRGDSTVSTTLTPRTNPAPGQGAIGVQLRPVGEPLKIESRRYPPLQALQLGFQRVVQIVRLTFVEVPRLALERAIPAEMARPVGPVGIFQITQSATERTSETGNWFYILNLAGMLGVGLGIANLLPIPGLDGGRLLFIIIEALRGRRVDPQREGLFHLAGFVFLISVMLLISYFDIFHPITGSDFGGP